MLRAKTNITVFEFFGSYVSNFLAVGIIKPYHNNNKINLIL